jgi:hypothetical protein
MGGSGPGRRWRTEQLNWALVLRLAAEFQGFARDLHDLAVDEFVAVSARGDPALTGVLRALATRGRALDRGNAHPSALGDDYGRLGLTFWDALRTADHRARSWQDDLSALIRARNAIAHADEGALIKLRDEGYPLVLRGHFVTPVWVSRVA